ncbi:hypothetical protein [Absidia glauca]|uniref:Ndc10 domain-containing protein n=1 Tax=Absidia glauca TaxID=4829 RepID=A0A163IUL4_ABSGL|nr:hypothetical protein [Absidia glauca]
MHPAKPNIFDTIQLITSTALVRPKDQSSRVPSIETGDATDRTTGTEPICALPSPGIRSNKKTPINCGASACMAGNVGANVNQIRRQGRWNNTTINGAYLTNIPRELVRSMAGFPTYGRFFYTARASRNPPTSLCKKLFPAIGE